MSSNDKLIQEIAAGVRSAKAELDLVVAHLNQMQSRKELAQITSKELASYPVDDIWRSCGKMFMLQKKDTYTEELKKDETAIDGQISALKVKKHYLETTAHNAMEALQKAVQQK
ncbi:HDL399Wp [Eremothecium sinecaudum]|uniref:HDL399Wp n=1 Tax=Eremothecium sinecaudum TaxID=45286 RepID=A0A0X8HRY3_9SACH|nr:HDL399Wp [Eremothecium sinecaudum]AMD20345.1 HDL399Wp [Eremothecium sinecaudum]